MPTVAMNTYRVRRILAAVRSGNSLPVIADTPAGPFIVKLRGAAHGTAALVAEIVVAELAEAIGLGVPARALIEFQSDLVSDDRNGELARLLVASRGLNLGFQWLADARDLRSGHLEEGVRPDTAARILWLDWLVMNPDRTDANPNILRSHGGVWLIDHGSALGFHYRWDSVTEESPLRPARLSAHVFRSQRPALASTDALLAPLVTRDRLEKALASVPDDFLRAMRPDDDTPARLARRRQAYVAFLWKRLRGPRTWTS
jgi:HipA-like protein